MMFSRLLKYTLIFPALLIFRVSGLIWIFPDPLKNLGRFYRRLVLGYDSGHMGPSQSPLAAQLELVPPAVVTPVLVVLALLLVRRFTAPREVVWSRVAALVLAPPVIILAEAELHACMGLTMGGWEMPILACVHICCLYAIIVAYALFLFDLRPLRRAPIAPIAPIA